MCTSVHRMHIETSCLPVSAPTTLAGSTLPALCTAGCTSFDTSTLLTTKARTRSDLQHAAFYCQYWHATSCFCKRLVWFCCKIWTQRPVKHVTHCRRASQPCCNTQMAAFWRVVQHRHWSCACSLHNPAGIIMCRWLMRQLSLPRMCDKQVSLLDTSIC